MRNVIACNSPAKIMAEVLPTARVNVPADVDQLISFLSRLPDGWRIFVGWPEIDHPSPDVLVVGPGGHAALMSASGAAEAILDQWSTSPPAPKSVLPLRRLHRATEALRSAAYTFGAERTWLILTRASEVPLLLSTQVPARMLPLAKVTIREIQSAIEASAACPADVITQMRARVSYPSVIPSASVEETPQSTQALRFLDPEQEQWLRRYLTPPPEAERPFDALSREHMVTGVAGSGKTLLLLHRVMMERKNRPELKVLFVTHNNALAADISRRSKTLGELLGVPPIKATSFFKWCRQWVEPWPQIVQYQRKADLLSRCIGQNAEAISFYSDEFAWISDEGIESLEAYRAADRKGRVRGLAVQDRPRVWDLYVRYRNALLGLGNDAYSATDWPGAAQLALARAQSGSGPRFDLIVADEAQFLSPVAIRVLVSSLQPDGRLVLAADPTQGFLQRRSPWASAGLDFRGKATRLKRPYRSTKQILEFAKRFYLARNAEDLGTADINLPDEVELALASDGAAPEICVTSHIQDEPQKAAKVIDELIGTGVPPQDVLVLHPGGFEPVRAGNGWRAQKAKDLILGNEVKTCTLETATGLEAPYVIVIGLRILFEPEGNPALGNERAQIHYDNTKKAYMAFTRAGHRLLVTWSGDERPTSLFRK